MKKNGFTLLEALISITIGTFLLFSALTSWGHFKQKNEVQLIINEIKTAIHYAKIQAISSNRALQLTSDHWSQGMNLISVHTHNKVLIHQWRWDNPNWDVHWQGVNGIKNIIIKGTASRAMSNGRFVIANKHNGQKIELVLNKLGRIRQI